MATQRDMRIDDASPATQAASRWWARWRDDACPGGDSSRSVVGRHYTAFGRRDQIAVLVCVVVTVLLFAITLGRQVANNLESVDRLRSADFMVFWSAARLVLEGGLLDLFDQARFQEYRLSLYESAPAGLLWLYPPHSLFFMVPLGSLPYLPAYIAWVAMTLGAYALAVKHLSRSPVEMLALVLAPAVLVTIMYGQNGLLTAALLVGGMGLADRRPMLSGVLLGLLCYKPQLALLVPIALLAERRWQVLLSAGLTAMGLLLASVVFFGAESWEAYLSLFHGPRSSGAEGSGQGNNPNSASVFINLVTSGVDVKPALYVQSVVAAGAAALAYIGIRRAQDQRIRLAIILIGTFLVTPWAWAYDFPMTAVAVLCLMQVACERGFLLGERIALTLLWFAPVVLGVFQSRYIPLSMIALLGAYAIALVRANQSRSDGLDQVGADVRPREPGVRWI